MWPSHCVENTEGAEFYKDLVLKNTDIIVKKGMKHDCDSYSAFRDEKNYKTNLDEILQSKNINTIYICGLALDYCVRKSALDAIEMGYNVFLVLDACKGINEEKMTFYKNLMKEKGIIFVQSTELYEN
jgi:nicotinamidase/pyrazinamidase